MKKKAELSFNVLMKKKDDLFVAHCLELDIVGVAKTEDKAIKELSDLLVTQISFAFSHENQAHLYKPAPSEFWQEFMACATKIEGKLYMYEIPDEKKERHDIIYPSITTTVVPQTEDCTLVH